MGTRAGPAGKPTPRSDSQRTTPVAASSPKALPPDVPGVAVNVPAATVEKSSMPPAIDPKSTNPPCMP